MKGSTSKSRNRNIRILVAGAAGGLAMALPQVSQAALLSNVVFNDTLASSGSTLGVASQSYPNSASPTATSTNYDIASSKDATASTYTSGSPLALKMVSSSSGTNEVQAVFTSAPVVLSTIGQAVEITATFTNAAGLNLNSSSSVDIGLYSSAGSTPYNNLYDTNSATAPSGVSGIATANAPQENSGGVQPWNGYETDYFGTSSTKIYTRPSPAVGTNNTDQALIVDGQTGGSTGTQQAYASQNSTETLLTVGNVYTDEMIITLTGTNLYTISEALYNGSTDTGTQVGTTTTTTSTVPGLTGGAGFDGLALGLRESDSVASEMDISHVEITTNVPEPVSFSVLSLSGLALMRRKRRA